MLTPEVVPPPYRIRRVRTSSPLIPWAWHLSGLVDGTQYGGIAYYEHWQDAIAAANRAARKAA